MRVVVFLKKLTTNFSSMNFYRETDRLLYNLKLIKHADHSILGRSSQSIIACQKTLKQFKEVILKNGFNDPEEEVEFFKVIKQVPLANLVYFSELYSFELQFPKVGKQSQTNHIKNKIKKLNCFFTRNLDFGRYVEAQSTTSDREYYMRNYKENFYLNISTHFFQDPDFSTPRDLLLAKYKAYKRLANYLDNRLKTLGHDEKDFPSSTGGKLPWSFSHTDWVELVYALHAAGLNKNGQMGISEISQRLQRVFDYTPPRKVYQVYQEIKNRKERSLFLGNLQKALISEMDRSEK